MLLIIQTGDPVPQAPGRFSDWFLDACGLEPTKALVVDVHRGQTLPDLSWSNEHCDRAIITGSPHMVTDRDDWLKSTQIWLEQFMFNQRPILGVCYGHQLLADLLGGRVEVNPLGRNMGLSQCQLTKAATKDRLFTDSPDEFPTLVSHLQSVTQAPNTAIRLAHCEQDPNHAFVCHDHIWGLQFHPEWTTEIMQQYLTARQEDLVTEGFDPITMSNMLASCPDAKALLTKFMNIG